LAYFTGNAASSDKKKYLEELEKKLNLGIDLERDVDFDYFYSII
jgi:hypothetical protein